MFVFRAIYAGICLQAYVHRHEFELKIHDFYDILQHFIAKHVINSLIS